ncbi:inactive transglutaminase family protein [Geoalkalibacter halelectricus]|uniref:Inactive transglutaminase family protein n=1 Tax=Geoalkalibacter halelectricus TaxID=2847045 RepID=A0ABY5ZQF7_9BACT|nr:inactive transglutaminase family protein [Geoalkalibacter halelectricus]MDO3378561.1 inactive transglutaminase family protein [Geoalkalibacter halelectricus]UWZ80125.1 inactive transglutaminase family protein [Geoalkalibacter halelectricus]
MKMSRTPVYLIALVLVIIACSLAVLRHARLDIPFFPGQQRSLWLVEARVDFHAEGGEVTVSLDIPDSPPGFRVIMEQAASPGYGFSIIESNGDRRGEWTIRSASGPQTLYYKAQVVAVERSGEDSADPPPPPAGVFWDEPQATAADHLLARALATSSTPESLARELIKLLTAADPGQNAALLLSTHSLVEALDMLLRQAGVPTRLSRGLVLEDARRRQQLVPLIEVYSRERWVLFDPATGSQELPRNLLLWYQGGRGLLDVEGGSRSGVSFSMIEQTVPALELARAQMSPTGFAFFDIQHLPIEEQSMFKMLLLLPVAALVVVFMRILVGLRTSGTFMPILIALAFIQTSLLPGLVSFVAIVALGLLIRAYLSRLNLLLVARIAVLVVVVVFIICFFSVLGYRIGLNTGMTITFFPMIIIAWTIERMSILWEEEGYREVLIQGGGSLIVAVFAYALMKWPLINHLSFNFPELNLIPLALILLVGQYGGYRLTELWRFRAFEDHAP